MTKTELKEIIKETILTEMEGSSKYYPGGKTPGLTTKVMDTILMNIAKGNGAPKEEKPKEINEGEEKTYEVTYYIAKNDDDLDYDKTVKATSETDAISKVKATAPRNARAFSAKLKK